MDLSQLGIPGAALPCAVPATRCKVSASHLLAACRLAWERGGQLVSLWASDERDRQRGFILRVLLRDADGFTMLEHELPDEGARYPDLATIFPVANRMQRSAYDLVGVRCDADDQRSWTRHASWPVDRFPLRRDFAPIPIDPAPAPEDYAFVRVSGDGVHEIPVGPIHAGIIEPGHFRLQVVGEKVLRLEERLAYAHKGIEKRFEGMPIEAAGRLAGRVSGDSTVAYAWAYAQALELIAAVTLPARALWLRALLLERERVANHLGDLGYLGNDGGLSFGLAQFSRLKEDVLRTNQQLFGHRLLMDVVVPGGCACDLAPEGAMALRAQGAVLREELTRLRHVYDEHAGLQDRFRTCGVVSRDLALKLGMTGLAARASGIDNDLRCELATAPYDALEVRAAVHSDGDVAARVAVRFDELIESLRLIDAIVDRLPVGESLATLPDIPAFRIALGAVEGWRGPVLVALESGPDRTVRRCHPHDPSWQNWPAIEHAVIGNIVPDFPLINKSFNLSFSGHDL